MTADLMSMIWFNKENIMDIITAKSVFNIGENDTIYKNGLTILKQSIEKSIDRVNSFDKRKLQRQIEAINVLMEIAK